MSLSTVLKYGLLSQGGVAPLNPVWSGLTSYYRFDEESGTDVADSKGSIDGTLVSGSWNASGKNNGCFATPITLNATACVVLGDVYNFERTDTWSVNAWVYRYDSANRLYVFCKMAGAGGSYRGHQIRVNSTGYVYVLIENAYPTNGIYAKSTTTNIPATTWTMVGYSYDGSSSGSGVKMYVNGTPQSQSYTHDNLSSTIVGTTDCRIGANEIPVTNGFGRVDELGVWNRVLTPTEMTNLYNSGDGLFY